MRGVVVLVVALWSTGAAAASTVLLPSPTQPLGSQPPLRTAAPTTPVQLPRPPRGRNSQEVYVDVDASGAVTRVRVRQQLTLLGLGDYFFQIPAPVRDVQALPESQSDPGLRRSAILWQGFSAGRRLLAAELELAPDAVAPVLPLRIARRGGVVTLRNTTATDALGFAGRVSRSSAARALARVDEQATGAPAVEVNGRTTRRRLRVDAPLRVEATVEQDRRVLRRLRLVLGGPKPAEATIRAPAGTDVTLTAEPVPLLSDLKRAPRDATAEALLLRAERALFRLARVNQYRALLASPTIGRAEAVYRYRTVAGTAAQPLPAGDEDADDLALAVALVVGGIVALAGAVVAWAHL